MKADVTEARCRRWAVRTVVLAGVLLCFTASAGPLRNYIESSKAGYEWEVRKTREEKGLTIYDILLVSQEWKTGRWTHQLRIWMPERPLCRDTALLVVVGGSNRDGRPRWYDLSGGEMRAIARVSDMVRLPPVVVLRQVPNQPLLGGRREDALISRTFERFVKNGDPDWLLLFPMVKSVVRAMDATQEVSRRKLKEPIEQFVVAGASKRGWTTWLTASQDRRVAGIAPMVFDVLNMQKQMPYQKQVWGDYSRKISDYENSRVGGRSLLDLLGSPRGERIVSLVDPYAYRDKITVPTFIFLGTNDPYWPVDAARHYYADMHDRTSIHYVANAGHGLADGIGSARALAAFTAHVAEGSKFPGLGWNEQRGESGLRLRVEADAPMRGARLWTARSDDRDFRDEEFTGSECDVSDGEAATSVARPDDGYRAAYVDVTLASPAGGTYTQSTRMFVLGAKD